MGKKYEKAVAIRASLIDQLLMQHGYSMPTPDIIAQATNLESYIKNGGSGVKLFPGFERTASEAALDRAVEPTPHVDRGPSADWGTDHQMRPEPVSTDPFARIAERIKRDGDSIFSHGEDMFFEFGVDEYGEPRIKQVFPKSQQMDRDNRQAAKDHDDGSSAALREEVMKRSAKDFEKRMKEETGGGKAEGIDYWSEKERDLRNIHMLGNLAAARIAISELCGWALSNKDWYAGQKGLEQVDMAIHRIFAIMSSPPHIG